VLKMAESIKFIPALSNVKPSDPPSGILSIRDYHPDALNAQPFTSKSEKPN